MKTLLLSLVAAGIFSHQAIASHEGEVPASEIILKQDRIGAEVKITKNDNSSVSITVTIDGKEHRVPDNILSDVSYLQFESVRFLMHFPHGGAVPDKYFRTHGFVVAFDYGKRIKHGKPDGTKTVRVYPQMRLHFGQKDGFIMMERAEPQGMYSNRWKLFLRNAGEEEVENGEERSVWSPY